MSISIGTPLVGMLHFDGLRLVGTSRRRGKQHLVHYNRRGKVSSRTDRNTFGQPNHTDRRGHSSGFSRAVTRRRYEHFDLEGNWLGSSRRIGGLLWIHSCRP